MQYWFSKLGTNSPLTQDLVKIGPLWCNLLWKPIHQGNVVFSGFPDFYKHFIKRFLCLVTILKKGACFTWFQESQSTFNTLKQALTSAPLLLHPDPTRLFVVELKAPGSSLGMSYHSPLSHVVISFPPPTTCRKCPSGCNYDTLDKELVTAQAGFEEWQFPLFLVWALTHQ